MALMMRTIFTLFIFFVSLNINAQISGTLNVPGTYPNLEAALSAINASGINGNTTIEMSANETAPVGGFYLTNFTGNGTYSLTLKAIGNVTLTAPVGNSNTLDGIFIIEGASNITIDGFTFAESVANTTPLTSMEWGIALLNNSATIGSNNCTIKNCTINFAGTTNTNAVGIYAAHHTKTNTTPFTVQQNSGAFSGLEIVGNTINSAYHAGIKLLGSGYDDLDTQITIGEKNAPNIIKDFGGSTIDAFGVYLSFVHNVKVENNNFDNLPINIQTGNLTGIYLNASDFIDILSNSFRLSIGNTANKLYTIRANGSMAKYLKIDNNTITSSKFAGGNGSWYGIANNIGYKNLIVTNNKFIDNIDFSNNGANYIMENLPYYPYYPASDTTIFSNNTIKNWSRTATATQGAMYGFYHSENLGIQSTNPNCFEILENNLFENIKGALSNTFNGSINLIYSAPANYANSDWTPKSKIVKHNIIRNIGNTKGDINCIISQAGQRAIAEYNIVENISNSGTGKITGISIVGFKGDSNVVNFNRINNLIAGSDVFACSSGTSNSNSKYNLVSNDTITNIFSGGKVVSLEVTGGQQEIRNNLVQNQNAVKDLFGIRTNFLTAYTSIYNNTVDALTITQGASLGTLYGVSITTSGSNIDIYKNTITNIVSNASTSGSVYAFKIFQSTGNTIIHENLIKNVAHNSGTTAIVAGINARLADGTFYNNIITDLKAGTSTHWSGLNAILLETSGNCKFYHNTIKMQGSTSGCGVSALHLYGNSCSAICKNNIFYVDYAVPNTQTCAIIRRLNLSGNQYNPLSSNNIYYIPNERNAFFHIVGTTTFSNAYSSNPFPLFGGVYDPNFNNNSSTYKSFLTGESNSFYEKTQWNGYIPIGSTYADNGGVFINTVSTDFAGQNRSIINPDIGAYEFTAQAKIRFDSSLALNMKVFLNNVNPTTSLMDNYLATLNTFPSIDPYSVSGAFNANFTHVNDGVVQKTEPTLLNKTGNNGIVDWVFVELRQGNSGSTSVIQTQAALLQRDGDIVGMDGVSPVYLNGNPDSYYITIRHRNHLGFRTANKLALSTSPTPFDFTNNAIPLYGAFPTVAIGQNQFAMCSGDANSDGSVDAFDTIVWEQQNGSFDDYTLNSDYDMDGSVDAFDSIIWELNNGKFQELD